MPNPFGEPPNHFPGGKGTVWGLIRTFASNINSNNQKKKIMSTKREWTPIKQYEEILFDFYNGIARITIN